MNILKKYDIDQSFAETCYSKRENAFLIFTDISLKSASKGDIEGEKSSF